MVSYPGSAGSFDEELGCYYKFTQRFEKIFVQPHEPVNWEHYRSAITERRNPCFRGPDFLSISPARSATTWLFEQLRRNPSVYLPDAKETNYFVNAWMDGPYEVFFNGWEPHQLAGDISPTYHSLPRRAIRELHRVYPKTRLICILRNPIERVWSQILFDLTRERGGIEASHSEIVSLPEQALLSMAAFYSGANQYSAFLERWLDSYPSGQVLVVFFDMVARFPEMVLHQICEFLEVPDCGLAVPGRVNALECGPIGITPRIHEFLSEFYVPELGRLNRTLREHFGLEIPEAWHRAERAQAPAFKVVENYRGRDVYYRESEFHAVPHGEPEAAIGVASPHFWQVLPNSQFALEESLEILMAWLCKSREGADGPKLLMAYRNHNLVAFGGRVYALPQALGVWDRWYTEDPASVPGVLEAASASELVALLDSQDRAAACATA